MHRAEPAIQVPPDRLVLSETKVPMEVPESKVVEALQVQVASLDSKESKAKWDSMAHKDHKVQVVIKVSVDQLVKLANLVVLDQTGTLVTEAILATWAKLVQMVSKDLMERKDPKVILALLVLMAKADQ